MPAARTDDTYTQDVRIAADPDVVFDFLVDADLMVQWMGVEAELDPVPGGGFRIDLNGTDVGRGEYVVVDRPHRVVMTWGWEGSADMPPGSTEVEVTLETENGGTLLHFEHRRIPASRVAEHGVGWEHHLDRLATVAGGTEASG